MKRLSGYLTLPLLLGLAGLYLTRTHVPAARGTPLLSASATDTSNRADRDAARGSQQALRNQLPASIDEHAAPARRGETESGEAAPLMLALYDELTEAIESLAPDCDGMAGAVQVVIDERASDLKAALTVMQGQPPEFRIVDDSAREATERKIREFYSVLKEQMPVCSPQLMPVLKRLTAMEREQ